MSWAVLGCGAGSGPDGASSNKRIFLTNAAYPSDFGGLSAADGICNATAVGAALGGTWKAWLSDASTNAIDRIADVGPWYLLSGTLAFHNKTNLTTSPVVPIDVNENGARVTGAPGEVWTGTELGGTKSSCDCAAWSSTDNVKCGATGAYGSNSAAWTNEAYSMCSAGAAGHLYCIEQ
jgi:hypothetical protein